MAISLVSDLIKNEINIVKSEVNDFISTITQYAANLEIDVLQSDQDFYSVLAKQILFFKYILATYPTSYYTKIIISDFYYYILSNLKKETRYSYLNERSIIENYLRMIVKNENYETHISFKTFEELKDASYGITITEYSFLRSEYVNSCGYIHGGQILKNELSSVFNECIKNDRYLPLRKRRERNETIIRLLKILNRLFIENNREAVSSSFHRRKTILKYLLGEESMEILFN